MLGSALAPLVMVGIGTVSFMVAGLVVCIGISIFTDTINVGGAFDAIAEKLIAVAFVPLLLAAQLLDVVMWLFVPPQIKAGLNSKV